MPREKVGGAAFAEASHKGNDKPAAAALKPRTLRRENWILALLRTT